MVIHLLYNDFLEQPPGREHDYAACSHVPRGSAVDTTKIDQVTCRACKRTHKYRTYLPPTGYRLKIVPLPSMST